MSAAEYFFDKTGVQSRPGDKELGGDHEHVFGFTQAAKIDERDGDEDAETYRSRSASSGVRGACLTVRDIDNDQHAIMLKLMGTMY
jgi:hypothetical protein